MKKILILACWLFYSGLNVFGQVFQWAQKQEKSYFTNQLNANGYSIPPGGTFLAAGNNLIAQTGMFTQDLTIGNQTFSSNDTLDAYLSVHNPAGNLLWAKQFAGGTSSQPTVVVDLNDNIIVSGTYTDSLFIDRLLFKSSVAGKGGVYIIKFDAAGTLLWARNSGSSTGNTSALLEETAIALDGAGNIYVAGNFSDTLTFNGSNVIAGPQNNLYLVKYAPNGAFQWLRAPTTAGFDVTIKPDAFGNIYLLKTIINPTFTYSHRIEKIDSAGAVSWVKYVPGFHFSYQAINLTVDVAGNPFISGCYFGSLTFSNSTISTSGLGCYLAKLDKAGNWKWARNIASNLISGTAFGSPNIAHQITVSPTNRIGIAGAFLGAAQFNGSSVSPFQNAGGTYIMQLDTAGTLDWVTTILNDSTWQSGNAPGGISSDAQGNFYVSGGFNGKAYFGNTSLTGTTPETTYLTKINSISHPLTLLKPAEIQSFKLFPNPTQNYVIVAADLKKPTPATVRLVNMLGQTISEVIIPANSQLHYQLPLNNLPKGVYLVQLESEAGRQTQRLVVQ